MSAPLRVRVRYANRRALLSSARTDGAVLSLFVPGSEHVQAGTEVTLELTVAGTDLHFEVDGRVRLQVSGGREGPGLGVVFLGERKRAASQMLASCSGGDASGIETRHQVDVSCLIDLHGEKMKGALKDVSSTGAFIGARKLAALRGQAELTIQLEPILGRFGGRVLKARVVWIGEKKGVPGFGVCFLDESAHVQKSLKKHLP